MVHASELFSYYWMSAIIAWFLNPIGVYFPELRGCDVILIWTYFFFNCIMWFWVIYTGLHYPGLKLNTASEDFPGRRLFWEGQNIPWLTYYIQWKREFGQKNNWPHYLLVFPHRSVFAFFFPLYGILFPQIHKSFTAHLGEIFTQML